MRFFPASSLTGGGNRPRSHSSATSSSSSSIDADGRYGELSADTYSTVQQPHPPPPTRTSTGLPMAQSSRVPIPAVSPGMNMEDSSTSADHSGANPSLMPTEDLVNPSTSFSAYLCSILPPDILKEVEEWDRRASQAEPLHYFSDNQHAQYVCKECMVPLVRPRFLLVISIHVLIVSFPMEGPPRRGRLKGVLRESRTRIVRSTDIELTALKDEQLIYWPPFIQPVTFHRQHLPRKKGRQTIVVSPRPRSRHCSSSSRSITHAHSPSCISLEPEFIRSPIYIVWDVNSSARRRRWDGCI